MGALVFAAAVDSCGVEFSIVDTAGADKLGTLLGLNELEFLKKDKLHTVVGESGTRLH